MTRSSLGLVIALSLGVVSCQQAPAPVQQVVSVTPAIRGQILEDGYHTAASIANEIAKGATVSLIDTVTGQTKGTTVTDSGGSFMLSFGTGFVPDPSRAYYMEAVKGLAIGGNANRAGAPLARVRTILFYRTGGWVSLTGGMIGSTVGLSPATTAVAAIVGLKGLTVSDQNALIGTVASGLDPSVTVISQSEFNQVYGLVASAIANDQDPIEVLSYDSGLGTFARKASTLVLDDVAPPKVSRNGTLNVTGQGLPLVAAEATVLIGALPVATWSTTPARTRLTVTTSGTQTSGFLQITSARSTWTGPFVHVNGTVGTFAGSGVSGFADGRGTATLMGRPHDVAVDAQGNVYVADNLNSRVRKITPTGVMTTLATGLGDITGVAPDASGNVYVATRGSNQVWRVSSTGTVTLWAGTGTAGSTDGATTSATFNGPFGVAVDSANNVYVSDEYGARIRKISPSGTVSTYAGTGAPGMADGATGSAQFNYPCALAIDTASNLYVADDTNSRIRKITPAGVVSTLGAVTNPVGVCVDAGGTVYAVGGDHTVKQISAGGAVTTFAGVGIAGFIDGVRTSGYFNNDYGVAVAPNGIVYVAEIGNHCIRAIAP